MHIIYYKDAIIGEMVTGYLSIGNIEPQIDTTLDELAAQQYFDGEPFFSAGTIHGGSVNFVFPEFPNGTDVNVYGLFVRDGYGDLICAAKLDKTIHGESGTVIELAIQIIPFKPAQVKPYVPPTKLIECGETDAIMSNAMRTLSSFDIIPKPQQVAQQSRTKLLADFDAIITEWEEEVNYEETDYYDP